MIREEDLKIWKKDISVKSTAALLESFAGVFAAVTGLKKKPQLHPLEFFCEKEGALWLLLTKDSFFYAETSLSPEIQLGAWDPDTKTLLRISGRLIFREEKDFAASFLKELPGLKERYRTQPERLIAGFLSEAELQLESALSGGLSLREALPDPSGQIKGISFKKKNELRDRLSRILERREAEGPQPEAGPSLPEEGSAEDLLFRQKLYDGALLYFAESAKTLWPRMDIRPIERAALFETYDERERFTLLAKRLIGNVSIEKPEDLSFHLSPEQLCERWREEGEPERSEEL